MRAAEILRSLADMIDQNSSEGVDTPSDSDTDTDLEVSTMVPPLQQKLEILKKATGVDNYFGNDDVPDELSSLKRVSGLPAIIISGEDNDGGD